jgi:hypothetical protein
MGKQNKNGRLSTDDSFDNNLKTRSRRRRGALTNAAARCVCRKPRPYCSGGRIAYRLER